MSFDFPSSPALRDTYTSGGVTYRFNGTAWVEVLPPVAVPTTIVGKRVAVMTDSYAFAGATLEQALLTIQYPIKVTGSSLVLTGGGANFIGTGAINAGWRIYVNDTMVTETRATGDDDVSGYVPTVACMIFVHGLTAGDIALCELRAYRNDSALALTAGLRGSPMLQVEELI